MRLTIRRSLFLVALAVTAVAAPPAAAENNTCARAQYVHMGQTIDDTYIELPDGRDSAAFYQVYLRAGHSYAFMAWSPFAESSASAVDLVITALAADCTTPVAFDGSFTDPQTFNREGAGRVLIATTTGSYHIKLTTPNIPPVVHVFYFLPVETTLVSPFWLVATGSGYDAAPQIANASDAGVDATLTMLDTAGLTVCSNTVNIPANGMTTFGISGAAPGCNAASGFGWMRIAHTAPPGMLAANLTTFSAMSGLSFDATFQPLQRLVASPSLR